MALVFPSDKELFEDLNTIGFDGTDISQHIEKRSFGIIYKAKLDEMLDVDNKNIVSAETESDAIEQIKQGNHQDYLDMEKTVNAYLNNYKTIGYFPGSEMNWYAARQRRMSTVSSCVLRISHMHRSTLMPSTRMR